MWRAFSSEIAIDSAFAYLKDNWKKVYNKFQHSPFALKQVLLGVLSQLSTKYDLDQVRNSYVTNSLKYVNIYFVYRSYISSPKKKPI